MLERDTQIDELKQIGHEYEVKLTKIGQQLKVALDSKALLEAQHKNAI